MQLPKLTPLQSRFAASFLASAVLVVLYINLKPQFAYAADLESRDHNHPIVFDGGLEWADEEHSSIYDVRHEYLHPRAPVGVSALANNDPQNMNIAAGVTQHWIFPLEAINGPHGTSGPGLPSDGSSQTHSRQVRDESRDARTVYVTLNTCLQPSPKTTRRNTDEAIPPQLELFISQSSSNPEPGPSKPNSQQQSIAVDGGYALATLLPDDDVYVGVYAPITESFTGIWNYEIAVSIDAPFHGTNQTWPNLFFVDGDDHAALLITNDTTQALPNSTVYQEWMTMKPPYGVFANSQNDYFILGVRNSYCGLKNNAQIVVNLDAVNNQNVAGMTNRGLGGKPKEQFYLTSLDASSTYWGFLAMEGNSTASGAGVVGGGGKVWAAINFATKTENNCALLYNLSFCSEVAYAVPSNPEKFSPTTGLPDLAALYDSYAESLYQYFNYSLQQIPCNTTSTAQYSLARNCDDCARAYKHWLCAVTIPRCEDYSSSASYLKPRNAAQPFINGSTISSDSATGQVLLNAVATNSSRNPLIDEVIRPGPYKEVLPCQDLCYDLVQSCPAVLGFGCPFPGRGLEDSYGVKSNDSGIITCSYLGAAYYLSGADGGLRMLRGQSLLLVLALAVSILVSNVVMF